MKIRVEYLSYVSQEVEVDSMLKDSVAKALRCDVIEQAVKQIRESGLHGSNIDLTIACMLCSLMDDPDQIKTVEC